MSLLTDRLKYEAIIDRPKRVKNNSLDNGQCRIVEHNSTNATKCLTASNGQSTTPECPQLVLA